MIRLVCAVYDSAAQAYGSPLFVTARGQAIRSFSDEVQRVAMDNPLNAHPDDFELFALGEFDDNTGLLTAFNAGPDLLVRGKDCAIKAQ